MSSLTTRTKICYAIGDIANGLAVSSTGFWFLIYLTDVAGVPAALAGLAMMIGRIWDAVTDPIMGWLSDHTKSPYGKRRVYLLYGMFPFAFCYFLLWAIPEFSNSLFEFFYVLTLLLIFNTAFTVVFVPYTSLTAVMTTEYHERTILTGMRMTASQFSFLVGAVLPAIVINKVADGSIPEMISNFGLASLFGSWHGSERQGYILFAFLFSLIMLLAIYCTFRWGSFEKPISQDSLEIKNNNIWSYGHKLYTAFCKNQSFRLSIIMILSSNVATTLIAVNLPYYLEYVLDLKRYQAQVVGLLFIAALCALPFWMYVSKRYGKAETFRIAMLFFVFVVLALYFVPVGNSLMVFIIAGLAGSLYAAALMIPWSIIPDIVDLDQLESGERKEGLFYGGTSFSYKFASALALFLSGTILQFYGYQPKISQQEETKTAIRLLVSFAPAIFILLAVIAAFKYKLNSTEHSNLMKNLNNER